MEIGTARGIRLKFCIDVLAYLVTDITIYHPWLKRDFYVCPIVYDRFGKSLNIKKYNQTDFTSTDLYMYTTVNYCTHSLILFCRRQRHASQEDFPRSAPAGCAACHSDSAATTPRWRCLLSIGLSCTKDVSESPHRSSRGADNQCWAARGCECCNGRSQSISAR